jgi:hypothetical protein
LSFDLGQAQWQYVCVETTIHLPDDLFQRVEVYAASKGLDVNEVITSAILRQLSSTISPPSLQQKETRVEFPLIPGKPDSPVLTGEQVANALEEELRNEAQQHAHAVRR